MLWYSTSEAITALEYPKFQAVDSAGLPLSGGKVYTYQVGSGVSKTTYSDYNAATANTNPVILNSRGEANIFLVGSYKIVLYDSSDNLVWTMDNVYGAGTVITSGTSGYIAIYSGVSDFSGVSVLSGASIDNTTYIQAGVNTALPIYSGSTITGKSFYVNLTSSESLSGATMYSGTIGNWGSVTGVVATLPVAVKGMNALLMLNQAQASAQTMWVIFPDANAIGLINGFSSGGSRVELSGNTLQSYINIESMVNGYWFITGSSRITYRNR